MNNQPNDNRQPNQQPNRQRPAPQGEPLFTREERLRHAFNDYSGYINEAPALLKDFTDIERALLLNDNEALGLLS